MLKRRYFSDLAKNQNFTVSALNSFLREVAKSSPGFRRQVDFSKGKSKIPLKWFFTKNGLTRLLEVSAFDMVDQVSLFLRSVVDVLCGNEENSNVTEVFTFHLDMASVLFRRRVELFCTNETLSELDRKKNIWEEQRWRCLNTIKPQKWVLKNGICSIVFLIAFERLIV